MNLKIGSLFTGYGGLDMAVTQVTGAETVWVSDVDKGANKILGHRYGHVPNHGDITRIDWSTVEPVDILTGGFPCQDLSHAGKRAGLKSGTRSGLWSYMAEAVKELSPRLVVVENVRGLLSADAPGDVEPCPWCVGNGSSVNLRALGVVLADLADLGFDARWCGLRVADVGGCHGRFRIFLIAYPADTESWWAGGQPIGTATAHPESGSDNQNPVTLLPTPAVNDMGAGKTVDAWDAWTDDMRSKHGNGNGHGKSLSIEAQRLLPTATRRDHKDNQVRREPHRPDATDTLSRALVSFGDYAPAVERWETVIGRLAPSPIEPRPSGRERLSPAFVEWMMGLPAGWVTDVPELSWAEQLKALGNGVVPQQAAAALDHMLGEL